MASNLNEWGLNKQREKFAQEVAFGRTLKEAYLIAYPKAKSYTDSKIRKLAAKLAGNEDVKRRVEYLREPIEEYLKSRATEIAETAYKMAMGQMNQKTKKKIDKQLLMKLLDKTIATKTENKSDIKVAGIEDLLLKLDRGEESADDRDSEENKE